MSRSPAERVAEEVRSYMARQRRSRAQLADRLGMSQAAVSRRLIGEVPFAINDLPTVADFLGIPLEALMAPDTVQVAS